MNGFNDYFYSAKIRDEFGIYDVSSLAIFTHTVVKFLLALESLEFIKFNAVEANHDEFIFLETPRE